MLTFAEYFAGIGLVREGLAQAGWSAVFANDIDRRKQQIYELNFGSGDFLLGDVHTLDAAAVPSSTLATASFPCTDLSVAGNRMGLAGEQSGAFWGFLRILKEMGPRRPPLVLLENVPGFVTSDGGADFIAVIQALNELGYRCDTFQLDARHFVPQSRLRVFIVGALADIMPSRQIMNGHRPMALSSPVIDRLWHRHAGLNWGYMPLPHPPASTANLAEVLEDIPVSSPLWWDEPAVAKMLGQMSALHAGRLSELLAHDDDSYGTVYRRVRSGKVQAELRLDGIAGCLRVPRGGSSKQFLLRAGRGQVAVRSLTPREYGRLQGVRDDFSLAGIRDGHAYAGFGDAVCVPAIQWIADHVLQPLVARAAAPLALV